MNPTEKSLVCLYSDANFLAINILENLLASNCFVNIITNDQEGWTEKTINIAAKNKFSIIGENDNQKNIRYRYIVCCAGFINKDNSQGFLNKFFKNVVITNAKTLVILPKEIYSNLNTTTNVPDNIGIVFVGDLLGPRIDLESNLKIPGYLASIIRDKKLTFPVGEVFYPLFVSDAAKQTVKWLFAFGPFGKKVILLGQETSSGIFWQVNEKLVGGVRLVSGDESRADVLPKNIEIHRLNKDLTFCLTETYKWISSKPLQAPKKEKKVFRKKVLERRNVALENKVFTKKGNQTKTSNSNTKKIFFLVAFTFLLPIFTLIISGGLALFSYHQFKVGHDDISKGVFRVANAVSSIGSFESKIFKNIPLIGHLYLETGYALDLVGGVSEIGAEAIPIIRTSEQIFNNVFGYTPYSVKNLIPNSSEQFQKIYKELYVLDEKTTLSSDAGSLVAKHVSSKVNFKNYKDLVSQASVIFNSLPDILGSEENQTYLILFENNMELRPTGGFIGSYGLLTFDGGRLADIAISDVYSADGQLKGHVEPPAAIKEHLGEANWWLRDSNWDPDFPTSAKRAEWFLDKEIDQEVDGVISIDLAPVKDFLELKGPVYLSDYGMEITANNMYEKVQSEVQDDFFPGTHKKASFLTALCRTIITSLNELSFSQKMELMSVAYKNLNEKHIQFYLHETNFQQAANTLGWDGSVFTPSCEGRCYSDLIGLVEANVGVNKANYFIGREISLDVDLSGGEIKRSMTLTLKNSANASLGTFGRYKSYVRFLVPEDAYDIKVVSTLGQSSEVVIPDIENSKGRKEIGFITEVLNGETKQLTFYWASKLDKEIDNYSFYFRKQAGVDNYPLSIRFSSQSAVLENSLPFSFSSSDTELQGRYEYWYNTTLAKDLFARLLF